MAPVRWATGRWSVGKADLDTEAELPRQIWGLTAGRGVFSKSLLECLLHRESLLIVLEGLLVLP